MKYMRFSRRKGIIKITALWGVTAYSIADIYESVDVQCLPLLKFVSDQSIHNIWAVYPPQLQLYLLDYTDLSGNSLHNVA
jgi:hypothetical protein